MTGKLRNVQALRAVAVMLVVWVHIGNRYGVEERYLGAPHITRWMSLPGSAGVDLFFVISGVIIMTTAWPAFSTPGAARQFAYRRVTRIFPPYWIVSALVLIVYLIRPHLVNSHDVHRPEVLQSLLILPQRGDPLLAVGWTLVYELYFYAIFCFALLFPRRLLPWIVGGWAAATLALHLAVGPTQDPSLFVVSNPMSLEFVFGVAIGYLIVRRTLVAPRLLFAASALALVVLLGHLAISDPADFPSSGLPRRCRGRGVRGARVRVGGPRAAARHAHSPRPRARGRRFLLDLPVARAGAERHRPGDRAGLPGAAAVSPARTRVRVRGGGGLRRRALRADRAAAAARLPHPAPRRSRRRGSSPVRRWRARAKAAI